MVKATVLIPTHNHDLTLVLSVRSVLNQTEQNFEILIIGDGATDSVKTIARQFEKSDSRIKFFDFEKGLGHGEKYRHQAILNSNSENIFYLCDDDLFLPTHLSNLIDLLIEFEFVQSRNGYINLENEIKFYPTNLGIQKYLNWHLRDPRRNCVSLTGTAHRRSTYFQLDDEWEVTPEDEWPDHFMWKKFFKKEFLKAATHHEMTTIQLPTSSGREHMTQFERFEELKFWADKFLDLDNIHEFKKLVHKANFDELNEHYALRINYLLTYGNIDF